MGVTSVRLLMACGRLWSALNFVLKLMSQRERHCMLGDSSLKSECLRNILAGSSEKACDVKTLVVR